MKIIIYLFLLAPIYLFSQEFDTFIDLRDSTEYKIVKIGEMWWMAENLKYWTENKGIWYYEQRSDYYHKYGYLYDWDTACNVCPDGWHLPSRKEWFDLINSFGLLFKEDYVPPTFKEYRKTPKAERKARDKQIRQTFSKMIFDGESGFNVLLGGHRDPEATPGSTRGFYYRYQGIGTIGYFWTSDDIIESGTFKQIKAQSIQFHSHGKAILPMPMRKSMSFSVRCIKD